MSLLLHLSDLHLGNVGHEDDVGDYSKSDVVTDADRVTRVKLVKSTLKALKKWLAQRNETLDAVIITGDVTTRGRADGFTALPNVLAALGDRLPSPDRVVVVPGNHDVSWGTDPGSPERYQAFLDGVRGCGFITPLLDGIDYTGDEPTGTTKPVLVGTDFAVFAINSADMCGVVDPLPLPLQDALARLVADDQLTTDQADAFRRLRMYDMPRIQPRQMSALSDAVATVNSDGAARVHIAALHHQLAPVREEEEVKPFESIVNLAAFTGFLADAAIDVVVHGHKHADNVQKIALTDGDTGRSAIVCSCGTIGGATGTGNEIAKLIRIHSDLPTLRVVEINTIPAVGAGQSLRDKIRRVYRAPVWRPPAHTRVAVISGGSAADVHEQLLALSVDPDRPTRDLICVVDDGATAIGPPSTYPWPVDASAPLNEWFPETVQWWQDATTGDGRPFTHGQRLRAWTGAGREPIDQVQAIGEILRADRGTSRGVAVLVDPAVDRIADKIGFPSFSLLHVWIDGDRLHCSAFFRKQEMTYWWAINAAEIAALQSDLIHDLHAKYPKLHAGSIRTHASQAVFSDQLPKVDVPRIDRRFWKNEDSIRVLAVAVADSDAAARADDIADLLELMNDWEPHADEPPADGAPVPGPGLNAIADALTLLAPRYPTSDAGAAADLLRDLDDQNRAYLAKRDGPDARQAYRAWRNRVRPKLERLRTLLDPANTEAPAGSPGDPERTTAPRGM